MQDALDVSEKVVADALLNGRWLAVLEFDASCAAFTTDFFESSLNLGVCEGR